MPLEPRRTSQGRTFIALPTREQWRETLPLAMRFTALFGAVFGTTAWIASLHDWRVDPGLAWDAAIPTVPAMALVYLSLTPLKILALFIFRSAKELKPLIRLLSAETLAAAPFFLIMPVAEPMQAHGGDLMVGRFADFINLNCNCFPSLHVVYAVTVAAAYGRRCGFYGRIFFAAWATAICASTLLIHAHYLLDVVGGLILAGAMLRLFPLESRETERIAAKSGKAVAIEVAE